MVGKTTAHVNISQVVLVVGNLPTHAGDIREESFKSWIGKIPWRRAWQLTPVSCLENPLDRGTWWATVLGVSVLDMTERLTHTHNSY